MHPLKVAYVGHNLSNVPIEGHHVASRRIIDASISVGVDPRIFSIESWPNEPSGRNIIFVKSNTKPLGFNFSFLPGIASAFEDFLASWQIIKQIKSIEPDLVHVLNINKEVFLSIQRIMQLKKHVLFHFFHSPYVLDDDVFILRKLAFKTKMYKRHTNHLLVANHVLERYLVESSVIDPGNIHYIPYPVDSKRFAPADKKLLRIKHGLPTDRLTLVYVGALSPSRGLFTLLTSMKYIVERFPNALLFVSHPERKGEESYIRQFYNMTNHLNLQKNVVFRGSYAKIEEIYNVADVVVLPFNRPYWVDPPLVLLEAMSCGKPVVTRPVGAIGEIATGENAVLVNFENPNLLAEKITDLVLDTDAAEHLGKNARNTIMQEYSFEVVAKKLHDLYMFIVEGY